VIAGADIIHSDLISPSLSCHTQPRNTVTIGKENAVQSRKEMQVNTQHNRSSGKEGGRGGCGGLREGE
jgi:hypothetical protein